MCGPTNKLHLNIIAHRHNWIDLIFLLLLFYIIIHSTPHTSIIKCIRKDPSKAKNDEEKNWTKARRSSSPFTVAMNAIIERKINTKDNFSWRTLILSLFFVILIFFRCFLDASFKWKREEREKTKGMNYYCVKRTIERPRAIVYKDKLWFLVVFFYYFI